MTNLPSASTSPVDLTWNEAFCRVERYLRAHHLENRALTSELAAEIIAEAKAHPQRSAASEPVTLAMQVTHVRIGAWFARTRDKSSCENESVRTHRLLALVIANLPGRW